MTLKLAPKTAMASRADQEQDFASLRDVLARFSDGASLEQVEAAAKLSMSRRTLMRRLADMVEQGQVEKRGVSRAARYALRVTPETAKPPADTPSPPAIPLSPTGAELLGLVSRAQAERQPVGYQRQFLDAYRPNESAYLSAEEKARLRELGKTPAPQEPAGTFAKQVLNRLMIDLSFNSSRLEGNTYSLLDTERLIALGEAAEGKTDTDAQMILNHKEAIEFLVESAQDIGFNRHTILNLHALLADNLLADADAAGRLRHIEVGIAQSVFQPLGVPQLIEECFDQLLDTAAAIADPYEQAFFVMVQLPYLQPFDDVNKRVSRLAANIPLIKTNLAPLSFTDVPDDLYVRGMLAVYELNRVDLLKDVFLWAYARSSARYAAIQHSLGEPDPFRLRYRTFLKRVVGEAVRERLDKKAAARHVAAFAKANVAAADRARFVEAAESELLGLHQGNFARYQVRQSEFAAWHDVWTRKPPAQARRKRQTA